MADYCTVTEVKTLAVESGLNVVFDYDSMLATVITSASRAIDREIGKPANYLYPSTDATVRYFDGNGGVRLGIDDAVSISAVAVSESGGLSSSDYTAWSSSDYITSPYNETPVSELIVDTLNGSKLYWYPYRKAVKVTAFFGYSLTPPADVSMACKMQAIRWFMKSKQMFAQTGSGEQGAINLTDLDPEIAGLLWAYKLRGAGDE